MSEFHAFLRERLASGGFSTEDTLASFLPLAEDVWDAHQADTVAPLVGLARLKVLGTTIWFENAERRRKR